MTSKEALEKLSYIPIYVEENIDGSYCSINSIKEVTENE